MQKRYKKNKRGQLKLSFGMIFSIFLIIVFIGFAFYAIKVFFNFQDNASFGKITGDFQKDVDRIWRSSEASEIFTYNVPRKVELICFVDFEKESGGINQGIYDDIYQATFGEGNLVFYLGEENLETKSFEIENLDIGKITLNENPFCLRKEDGKVEFILEKEFKDTLVKVKRKE